MFPNLAQCECLLEQSNSSLVSLSLIHVIHKDMSQTQVVENGLEQEI